MGKNQGFKATQRAKHMPGEGGASGAADSVDGLVDASWHTPEWHAARIASLQVERLPWDEWKRRQKEEEARQALVAGEDERMMQEYRAQLAADREKRLARGTNHAELRDKVSKSKHKSKDKKKKKDKKKEDKKSRKSDKSSKRKREKSPKAKKSHKKRRRDSDSGSGSSSSDSSDSDEEGGPIRLSEYLKG